MSPAAPPSIASAAEAVARIAALASQTIVCTQPSLSTDSIFTHPLRKAIAAGNIWQDGSKAPQLITVRQNADPLLRLLTTVRDGHRTCLVGQASVLVPGVSHLSHLANHPVVLHIALESGLDYSQITAVRQSGLLFLQSETVQEVLDLAATAHALAVQTGRAVVHFFDPSVTDTQGPILNQAALLAYALQLDRDAAKVRPARSSGHTLLYAKDGKAGSEAVGAAPFPAPLAETRTTTASTVESPSLSAPSSAATHPSSSTPSSSEGHVAGTPSSAATSVDQDARQHATSEDTWQALSLIWTAIAQATRRQYSPFAFSGPPDAEIALVVFGVDSAVLSKAVESVNPTNVGVLKIRLYRPWLGKHLVSALPTAAAKIAVLEPDTHSTTRWGPLLLDVLTSLQAAGLAPKVVGYRLGHLSNEDASDAFTTVLNNLEAERPVQNLQIGQAEASPGLHSGRDSIQPEIETAYYKVLRQLFPDTLYIANQPTEPGANLAISSSLTSSPEFTLGGLLARLDTERALLSRVKETLLSHRDSLPEDLANALSDWAVRRTRPTPPSHTDIDLAKRIVSLLDSSSAAPSVTKPLEDKKHLFRPESRWIIGSDAWAYDIGNSGVHHLLASNRNINMLIIDSTPLPKDGERPIEAERRKKDIGLYAMNFGNAYVASVAVYSNYTHLLDAIAQADKFDGPSIVLAYLPYFSETDSPVAVLQETKRAVDSGYWPLYRWDPSAESRNELNFRLDSERLRQEYKNFLDRQNYLTQVMRRQPEYAASLQNDFGREVRELQKRQTKDAYTKLLEGLAGAPLTVLFASDNGNAEGVAKKIAARGKVRGLKTVVLAMDDYPFEDLASEENIVFVTSTAGQGEFPQNGRSFWEALKGATDLDLSGKTKVSVFGLGDSHYWPRKEDKAYYNKPAKDLFSRLTSLGAATLVEVGLGDDQDPDGFQTGYNEWEPKLWEALGVANLEGLPEEPAPLTMEDIKLQSNYLRGTIAEGLVDKFTGAIAEHDQMLTKFHGTYMQDDRDVRDRRKLDGLEPAYSFMIRCRLPGGVATPQQWVQMDDIATKLGNQTMKLTTRQTFQFHGVVKGKLKPAMQAINRALMTTLAACGDVNRNVMCSSLPEQSALHEEVQAVAKKISDHLLPSTSAYHEIWLTDEKEGKKQVGGDALVDHEPLYGPTYLPRKFKITIAVPPHNDTDVYAHDIGLIAIKDHDGSLLGFNVLAGGGMGATHNNKKTYPQIGRMLGFAPAKEAHIVCEKIMLVQKDHGDRKNRKHARLKYTIDDLGVDVFKDKVEALLGWKLEPGRPFTFTSNVDTFGWLRDERGRNHFTIFVENGRVEDTPELRFKTGLRELALALKPDAEFRLTGNQHVIVSNIRDEDLPSVKSVLAKYRLDNTAFSGLRLSSSACVAFPTCGLAMAESERYLPVLISKLESTLEEAGMKHDSIVMRMTGCPNGCARPWLAEIGLVGKSNGVYNLYLGGGYHGNRLSKLFRSNVRESDILEILRPLIWRYSRERKNEDERFGDFVIRAGVVVKTVEGRDFHDNTAEGDDE